MAHAKKAAKIMERWPSPLGVPSPETRTVLDLKQRVRPIDISPTDVIMLCIQYPSLVSTYLHAHMYIYIYDYIYRYDICISVFLLRWIRTIYIYHISYHHISYEYILHILMRTHTSWWSLAWKSGCQHVSTTSTHMCSENGIWKWVIPGIIIGNIMIIHWNFGCLIFRLTPHLESIAINCWWVSHPSEKNKVTWLIMAHHSRVEL